MGLVNFRHRSTINATKLMTADEETHRNLTCHIGQGFPNCNETVNKVGVLRRILGAICKIHQRHADREIANFVAGRGGRMTDSLEREITYRLLTWNWKD